MIVVLNIVFLLAFIRKTIHQINQTGKEASDKNRPEPPRRDQLDFKASIIGAEVLRGVIVFPLFMVAFNSELSKEWKVNSNTIIASDLGKLQASDCKDVLGMTTAIALCITTSAAAYEAFVRIAYPLYDGKMKMTKLGVRICCGVIWIAALLISIIIKYAGDRKTGTFFSLIVESVALITPAVYYVIVLCQNRRMDYKDMPELTKWKNNAKKLLRNTILISLAIVPYTLYNAMSKSSTKSPSSPSMYINFWLAFLSVLSTLIKAVMNYFWLDKPFHKDK